ncbi:MAG: type IV conjugative transfer system protein TraL [Syntrophorhabdus sp.]|jgi:type IV conjugative transfer system protein TraL
MIRIPQYLDVPFQVLYWESDEFAFILLFFTLALAFGGWVLWALLPIGPYTYIHFKRKYNRGFLKHLIYIVGFKEFHGYPSAFCTDFYE